MKIDPTAAFVGAKLIVFIGRDLLALRRDHTPGIVWPGRLDFPGGGREGAETPLDCALRETAEEVGLRVPRAAPKVVHRREVDGEVSWFFVVRLQEAARDEVVFGGEGLGWGLMAPGDYVESPDAIPHFANILRDVLQNHPPGELPIYSIE